MVLSRVTRIVAIISSKSHVLVSVRGSPEREHKISMGSINRVELGR